MGVKGLWKLLESAGVVVPLETLENKVLAVDVSIWLHQAVRGFRGPGGAAVANAHLLTLFHRICKLLFYRIKPIFVFDGGVPLLKKQTQASRKLRREMAANKAKQARDRLLKNLLRSQAVRNALGKVGPGPSVAYVARPVKHEKDMFELPPLPQPLQEETVIKSEELDEEEEQYVLHNIKDLPNLHQFELDSEQFQALPLETQHDLLTELSATRKQNSWNNMNDMPRDSESFAEFQMGRLMKRHKFQSTLDSTRNEIQKKKMSEMEAEMFGELEKYASLSQRIISEDSAHSMLVKKIREDDQQPPMPEQNGEDVIKEDKGKKLLKKNKNIDKDFLTELSKQGVFRMKSSSDSESDLEDDYMYECIEKENDSYKRDTEVEEEDFLQMVGSLMENSGLTQEEILALIQQGRKNETSSTEAIKPDGPSTSAAAPGLVYNPDAESTDDDDADFIEVTEPYPAPAVFQSGNSNDSNKTEEESDNVDALLKSKNNSLWMKIVQQKLDDMVHSQAIKPSPKKAVVDTRKLCPEDVKRKTFPVSTDECLKPVKISLDFDVKPLKMEDDIFADIFTDINCRVVSSAQPQQKATVAAAAALVTSGRSEQEDNSKVSDEEEIKEIFATTTNSHTNKIVLDEGNRSNSGNSSDKGNEIQDKIHDYVRIEIEKMVSSRAKLNSSNAQNQVDSSKEEEQVDLGEKVKQLEEEVEFMSSSDDSDVDDVMPAKTKPKGENIDNAVNNSITKPHSPKIMEDSDNDTDDFVEVIQNDNESNKGEGVNEGVTIDEVDKKVESSVESKAKDEVRDVSVVSQRQGGVGQQLEAGGQTLLSTDGKHEDKKTAQNERKVTELQGKEDLKHSEVCAADSGGSSDNTAIMDSFQTVPEPVAPPLKYSEDELKHLEKTLATEQQSLVAQAQRSERLANNLNDQMYGEAQHLLQLFGIPYIVAPMEAEAQCAFLDQVKLTAGTITDDSDIFLFGGNSVYRNFFDQNKSVEFFKTDNITGSLGLDRLRMITLALLTGSDYTVGVESVGAVAAMEVLAEFPGTGIECLRNLKKWWNSAHKNASVHYSKVKQKFSQVMLSESFPNENVFEAYLKPEVDESRESFTWAIPNVDALRSFTGEKFGWNSAKVDQILVPVMKKLGLKSSQMRIDSYFTSSRYVKELQVTSKRVQEAIAKVRGEKRPHAAVSTKRNLTKAKKPRRSKSESNNRKEESDMAGEQEANDELENTEYIENKTKGPVKQKCSRTLLMDTTESSSGPVKETKQKTKKDSAESNNSNNSSGPSRGSKKRNEVEVEEKRKLTKEVMYQALLEKEKIHQREESEKQMQQKKLMAAQVLQKQFQKKTKKS